MKRILLLLALGGAIASLLLTLDVSDQPTESIKRRQAVGPASDGPVDFRRLPGNALESICQLGHPVLISGWDAEPDTRFLIFAGEFVESDALDAPRVYPYLYMAIGSLTSDRVNTTLLIDSIDEHRANALPEELSRFKIPIVRHGLPEDADRLAERLGKPTVEQQLNSPERTRLIYHKKICLGDKLVAGLYVDVAKGRLVKAKGIVTDARVEQLIRREVLPDPDPKPIRYADTKPLLSSPQETFVEFILAREAGDQTRALEMVSDSQTNGWLRSEITSRSEPNVNIDPDTLYYQTTKYE